MLARCRLSTGSGIHAYRMEVLLNKRWHFVKWVSKHDKLTRYSKKNSFYLHLKTTSSSNQNTGYPSTQKERNK